MVEHLPIIGKAGFNHQDNKEIKTKYPELGMVAQCNPDTWKVKQEDQKFKITPGYKMSFKPA